MSFEATALLLAWGAIAMLAFALAGLLRQVKVLTGLINGGPTLAGGPAVGGRLPPELFSDVTTNGSGRGRLLVFMGEHCPTCAAIEPELARISETERIEIRLVFRGSAKPMADGQLPTLEGMSAAFDQLKIPATPFALHIGTDGRIEQARPIGSPEALRQFVEATHEETSPLR
jgi:thiol-disulfide isomerase/thioredoxin